MRQMEVNSKISPSLRRGLYATASVGCLLMASAVYGQSLAANTAADARKSGGEGPAREAQSAVTVGDVVVTARRRTERLLDVPVAATAVTMAQIRQYDFQSVADIKLAVPNISFDRGFTGSAASIALRGVSSSSLDAGLEQSVLLDYDGTPISRGRVISDGLFDVGGIDVLEGPQALFFGKNSPGGVVSIKSLNPTSTWQGYVRAGYEFTAHEPSVEAAIGGPITDKLGVRIAIIESQSDGYEHNNDVDGVVDPFRTAKLPANDGGTTDQPGKALYGAESRTAGRLTLRYEDGPLDATFKMLASWYSSDGLLSLGEVMSCPGGAQFPITTGHADPNGDCHLDGHNSVGLPPQAVLDSWPEVRKYNNGHPYTRDATLLPTLTVNYKIDNITLSSITSLFHYDFVNQGNADSTSYSYYYSYNDERNTSFVQELRAVSSFEGPLNFAVGGYYEHDDRPFQNGTASIVPIDPATGRLDNFDLNDSNKADAFSGFAQVSYKPVPSLEIAGGARYTSETTHITLQDAYVNPVAAASFLPVGTVLSGSRSEDNISPEATITWHPMHNVMIYGAYKTGYLAGGFSNPGNIGIHLTIATDTYGEEKARGFEGGSKFSLMGDTVSGSLVGYRYTYSGLQLTSLDSTANPPIIRTQNAGSSLSQGLEFNLNYRPVNALLLRTSVNYNDAHFNSFPAAQCYAGQTSLLGCVGGVQSLSGSTIYRAPKWVLTLGASYDFDLGAGYRLQVNGDLRSTSGYFTELNENPLSYQGAYVLLNAGARLTLPGDRWSVAVIGRNLNNKFYGTLGSDKVAGVGEVVTVPGEPRTVAVQVEARF